MFAFFGFMTAMTFSVGAVAVNLAGQGENSDLMIQVQSFRGVKAKTKNNTYTKLRVQRGGDKFEIWCGRSARFDAKTSHGMIKCEDHVETVSDDDNESLAFTVLKDFKTGAYSVKDIYYSGDGTFFGKQVAILAGPDWSDKHLEGIVMQMTTVSNGKVNPFAPLESYVPIFESILKKEFQLREPGVALDLVVASVSASIETNSELSVSLWLKQPEGTSVKVDDFISVTTTALNQAGDLDSGYKSATDLAQELDKSLKLK